MPTSKIKNLDFKDEWKWKDQTLYKFSIEFENGDQGDVNFKSKEPKYKVGDEVTYSSTPNGDYPNKIKIEQDNKGGFKSRGGDRKAFALSYAKDLAVARLTTGASDHTKTEDILKQAEAFLAWMEK